MSTIEGMLYQAHEALKARNWIGAEESARRILREDPTNSAALCILGATHSDRGDDIGSISLFKLAIACDRTFVPGYVALASRFYRLGMVEESVDLYDRWSEIDPENPEVQHMRAALTGVSALAQCTDAYLRAHFNAFAEHFDKVLVDQLAYCGPEIVAAALVDVTPAEVHCILDAGCGTGLCGPLIRGCCQTLVGVDIAERMIDIAHGRGCYDSLVVGELVDFLGSRIGSFDRIVAADVFIYFGTLEVAICAARRALKRNGFLIFTVEALTEGIEPYRLSVSGRYAHHEGYIREVLRRNQMTILSLGEHFLRTELGQRPLFYLVVAQSR